MNIETDQATIIYFNNHGSSSPGFIGIVADLACLNPRELPVTIVECDDFHYATHGVIHLDEDEIGKLHQKWESNPGDIILLRVSEGGKESLSRLPHERWVFTADKIIHRAYILNLRNYPALTRAAVAQFCSLSINQAELVYSGDLERLTPTIKKLFTRESSRYLIALDILCQGYLASHNQIGSYMSNSTGFRNERITESTAKLTEEAHWWLRGMGISSFRQLEDTLIDSFMPVDKALKIVELLRSCPHAQRDQNNTICKLRHLLREFL